jgi:nucleotide-binding universal stress UspA family protein
MLASMTNDDQVRAGSRLVAGGGGGMTESAAEGEHGRSMRRLSTQMRSDSKPGSPHMLVGHDSHPASRAAVRLAADLASRLSAYLHVVHVVDLGDTPIDADSAEWDDAANQTVIKLQADARELLADFTLDWSYHACHGDPVELLARIAVEYDVMLVAVGATGRNITRRLLEGGSVSRRLLRYHAKPVLVVPEPPQQ